LTIFLSNDPLCYKLRWLRYHWRCLVAGIFARDWEGVVIDYIVHMVRYGQAER